MIAAIGKTIGKKLVAEAIGGGSKAAAGRLAIGVEVDTKEVEQMLWRINQDVVPRATVSALNKTARKLKTLGIRETADATGVTPQTLIRERYRVGSARLARPEATIRVLLRAVPAIRLGSTKKDAIGARQGERGVTAGNRSYPSAWIMESSRGGGPQVFHRLGRERFPVGVHKVVIAETARAINDRLVTSNSRELFNGYVTHELKWRLGNVSR